MKNRAILKKAVVAVAIFVLAFLISYSQILYDADRMLSDPLMQTGSVPNGKIKIIAIDEKTLQKYGNVSEWTREPYAQLVSFLSADSEKAPAVIVFDMMFVSNKDAAGDAAFAQACDKAGNVITAINVVYRDQLSVTEDGMLDLDSEHISMIEYPYEALGAVTDCGFANTYIDRDGIIRYARTHVTSAEGQIDSLAMAAYKAYAEATGEPMHEIKTENGFFAFAYTAKSGEGFEVLSLCDVLDGKIDAAAFRDSIVLVGAYAPGMQDGYGASIDKREQMYGVEIHANVLKAMMEGNTAVPASKLLYALISALVAVIFFVLIDRTRIVGATVALAGFLAVGVAVPKLLFACGLEVKLIYPLVYVLLIYAVKLVLGYVLEVIKKRRILNAFKKYVAPEVVQEIAGKGEFAVKLGGENRHVAVLFVDIRGFTVMSEGLAPETVVEILNEYLRLTTNAIFKNRGTLDKFIGDATMAVFNAPFDLDDYVFRAVCAALDIANGSDELEKKLTERFGKSISFGIGVHCGNAVVGNIGCEHRMDYTAIGDTVNTAARLESNAGRGQILISQEVYDVVKDRVNVTDIGVIPLKGKSQEVYVYQLDGLKNTEET